MHASKNIFSSTPYLLNWAKAGFGRHDLTWNREALLWFGVGTFWKNYIFGKHSGCGPPLLKFFFRPVATKGSSAVVEIISPSNAKALH